MYLVEKTGIIAKAQEAKKDSRGGQVKEAVELTSVSNLLEEVKGGNKRTKADLIEELQSKGLLTTEEVQALEESDTITIGNIEIDFGKLNVVEEKNIPELVGYGAVIGEYTIDDEEQLYENLIKKVASRYGEDVLKALMGEIDISELNLTEEELIEIDMGISEIYEEILEENLQYTVYSWEELCEKYNVTDTTIGDHAFSATSIVKINIPDTVTTIESYAFPQGKNISSITIPSSVTSISEQAFYGNDGIESIIVDENNPVYDSRNNCNAIIETATDTLFYGCKNTIIPNTIKIIGYEAFYWNNSVENVNIPEGVNRIENYAFNGTNIKNIVIPSSVTHIGVGVFSGCSYIKSIIVDENNPVYDSRNNCNAIIETATNTIIRGCKNTQIPESVTKIGNQAYEGDFGIIDIIIPNSVTEIGNNAFFSCRSLESITIPSSVNQMYNCTFELCERLTSITIDENNPVYDSRDNCNAVIETATNTLLCGCKNTVIPNGVTTIGKEAFQQCAGLESIIIPSSVTTIEKSAFQSCHGLKSITIPSSVTTIVEGAFYHCTSLTSITFEDPIGWKHNSETVDLSNPSTAAELLTNNRYAKWEKQN